jgi:hypothetical protein
MEEQKRLEEEGKTKDMVIEGKMGNKNDKIEDD